MDIVSERDQSVERVGRYLIGERIGSGATAEVFAGSLLGADGFRRSVAIKRIKPDLAARPDVVERFVRAARVAASLHHPNIAAALDFDRDARGRPLLVTERIDGVDLATVMAAGRMPLDCAAAIVAQVLRALAYSHELSGSEPGLGVVHRGVAPHNIMLTWTGAVKLIDFGVPTPLLASSSDSDDPTFMRTWNAQSAPARSRASAAYMSPEQVHGAALDGRSDVFSAGVVLYELLTGARLFEAADGEASAALVSSKKIAAPHALDSAIPPSVSRVCMSMLARDRTYRFAGARVALSALTRCFSEAPRGADAISELLLERLSEHAPPEAREQQLFLSTEPVPHARSMIVASARPVDRACERAMRAPTRTAPGPPLPAAANAHLKNAERARTRRWIAIALALAAAVICLAWVLTLPGSP